MPEETKDVDSSVQPKTTVEGVTGTTASAEKVPVKTGINYAHVRTNWSTYPPDKLYECVMISKSQLLSGSLTVPKQRAERILGVSDATIPVIRRVEGSPRVPVEEPFKPGVEVDTIHLDGCIVVWNAACTRGYMVKLKLYKSQPTQVFLHGLHSCFDELHVEPWSILCFVPIGVKGHCQLFVWPPGHPHYEGFQSCTVHQWSFMKPHAAHKEKDDIGEDDGSAAEGLPVVPEPGVLAIETAQGDSGMMEAVIVEDHFVSLSTEDITIVSPAPYPKKWVHTSGKMGRPKKRNDASLHARHSSWDSANATNSSTHRSVSAMQKQRRAGRRAKENSENIGSQRGLEGSQATCSKTSAPFQPTQPSSNSQGVKHTKSITVLRRRTRKARPIPSHTV